VEAASLPRAPPAVKAPIHTQHPGRHGDDGLIELLLWRWPDGSHGGTTPLPWWSWGSEPGSGLSAYCTGRGATQGRTPGLYRRPALMGSDPTRGRQCGQIGSTGRPGKTGSTTHTHTYSHTHALKHTPTHMHIFIQMLRLGKTPHVSSPWLWCRIHLLWHVASLSRGSDSASAAAVAAAVQSTQNTRKDEPHV
jgi:hypothetical protein